MKFTIDQFLIQERENLIRLIAETQGVYGRMPAEIVVGPPVARFGEEVKFFDLPVKWDPLVDGGQVLALMGNTSILDRSTARGLSKAQRERMVARVRRGY